MSHRPSAADLISFPAGGPHGLRARGQTNLERRHSKNDTFNESASRYASRTRSKLTPRAAGVLAKRAKHSEKVSARVQSP